jgi:hypothetical protein
LKKKEPAARVNDRRFKTDILRDKHTYLLKKKQLQGYEKNFFTGDWKANRRQESPF